MSKKEGVLEFVPPRFSIEDIGGYDTLKTWLKKRQALFSKEALDAGIPIPKGLLLMGISGCGKSLCVKTISTLWNLPLFRLDMNAVFGTDNPEPTFLKALRSVESVSPAVLWIDEIEMGVGGYREGGDASMSRIFSGFLTWMQEKSALVFVAATANRIQLLPAEIIRKGRFDQVFFVDLPNEEERKQIFSIHLIEEPVRSREVRPRLPRQGDQGVERRGDRADRRLLRRGRLLREPAPDRGRPAPRHLRDRAPLGHDGRADQGHQELGARPGPERFAALGFLSLSF